MSMDFTSSPQGAETPAERETPLTPAEGENTMFGGTPIWERSAKKRRGLGRSRPATTTAATAATVGPAVALGAEPVRDGYATTAIDDGPTTTTYTRTTAPRRSGGIPAVAIAAGVIALGGLAAAGWYASQPHDRGVAQLTPGAPGEAALSAAPAASTIATNTPAPMTHQTTATTTRIAAPAAVTHRTTTTRVAAVTRARPMARSSSTSAESLGVNASATLPAGPQPYAGAATASPSVNPAPTLPTTPPVEPAPAPSASSATPATPAPEPSAAPQASTTPQ